MFSDLDLNGEAPIRVHPRLGEWGPVGVPLRSAKRRMRVWVSLALAAGMTAIIVLGIFMYHALQHA